MRMNRRNVLVGLGTIVAGGGAALGTGAFSSVEADRTVSVGTTGDGQAYLGVSVTNSAYAVDGSSESEAAVTIDLGDTGNESVGFNDDATTYVNGILELTNNAADGNSIEVSLGSAANGHSKSQTVSIAGADVTFTLSDPDTGTDGDLAYATVSDGGTTTVDAEINTAVDNSGDDEMLTLYADDGSS
nr:hypothetical protein [Haloterrigena gelatinilytica]